MEEYKAGCSFCLRKTYIKDCFSHDEIDLQLAHDDWCILLIGIEKKIACHECSKYIRIGLAFSGKLIKNKIYFT